jgi:hypothetical protein
MSTFREGIQSRLSEGDTVENIAADLSLDTDVDECSGELMVLMPGFVVGDDTSEEDFPDADTATEAAAEYVADGCWGNPEESAQFASGAVTVYVWRVGAFISAPKCAVCKGTAIAHNSEGDPACAEHAAMPMEGIVLKPLTRAVTWGCTVIESIETFVHVDHDEFIRAVTPLDERDRVESCAHRWCRPHAIVGGYKTDPGIWSLEGTATKCLEVCRCGLWRETISLGNQRFAGEADLLTSYRYDEVVRINFTRYDRRDTRTK